MSSPAVDAWADLAAPWQECFGLAWAAFKVGSIPVGAVLVDGSGATVAIGRNRAKDLTAPAGQIAGSNIAHAEVNALATLPPGDYGDHVLYTTVEPCLLCTAALRHSHVGAVRFATNDPMWYGIDTLPGLNHNLARRWARRIGPLDGPLQVWAALLHIVSALERGIRSVVDAHTEAMPATVRLARRLATPDAATLRAMTLTGALAALWDDLAAC